MIFALEMYLEELPVLSLFLMPPQQTCPKSHQSLKDQHPASICFGLKPHLRSGEAIATSANGFDHLGGRSYTEAAASLGIES